MSYQGRKRVVMIGPRAQAVLAAFTPEQPTDFYFSPQASVEQFHAERAANRRTPKYASHMKRNATRAKGQHRKPRTQYTTASYGYAIRRAIERANAPYVEAGVELELHIPEWAPNQITALARHNGPSPLRPRSSPGRTRTRTSRRDTGPR